MINITDKHNCCGCSACASICPKQCISMVADNEGFLYPQVNKKTCIDCGLCEKACNELHPYKKQKPLKVLAAINKKEEIRIKSSSGGIFYILAEKIINEGGAVFGARFDNSWQVVIDYAEDMEGIEAFMGSKYVQARIGNAYKDVKRILAEGRKVLFSGTPCQIAGLHQFLRKPYENLVTIDFICHGTPSPKVWDMYLNEVISCCKQVKKTNFRKKQKIGDLNFSIEYNKNTKITSLQSPAHENHYMRAFLSDLILRPSCSSCAVKSCSSQSDITLADFWGVWNEIPNMNDDKGTSILLVKTQKGIALLPKKELVEYADSDYETVIKYNKACVASPPPNPKREVFFTHLQNCPSVTHLIDKVLQPPLIKRYIKTFRLLVTKSLNRSSIDHRYNLSRYINPSIYSISFRNKSLGWKKYQLEITIIDNQ